ncbi:pyrroline-5-carboxylate reductase [Amorphus sp. 3PC139-8]|uniref:pyrroline-5-carboxylate reductase n=1 Tax=Amorphus sp. 3PC139-8 TaxID=2735676 RepID=UPI00345C8C12
MSEPVNRPIVLVGAGKMGGAMLIGWGRTPPAAPVVVVDPAPSDEVKATAEAMGATVTETPPADMRAGVLILAVKPQAMADVLPTLESLRDAETTVVSVAAGITLATLEAALGPGPVIRTIPNTPAQIGRGVTVAVGNAAVGNDERAAATTLLGAIGSVEWVEDEALIDAATAVSGSGPAYVFHMVECLAEAGRQAGLPEDLSMRIARGTVTGAGALLDASEADAETLRRNVTSPGGTTAAALSVLMEDEALQRLFVDAVAAATKRARELGN